MSKPVRPRRLVHRGTVRAAALLFDPALLGEAAARRRALRTWAPGASLERCGEALLLRLPAPAWVDAGRAPGAPLVREAGLLLAAPLEEQELKALAAPAGAVVRVRGAAAEAQQPGPRLDPSAWLDTGPFALVELTGLGEPPAPVLQVAAPVVGREAFGKLPPAAPEQAALLAALRGEPGAAQALERSRPAAPGLLARLAAALGLGKSAQPGDAPSKALAGAAPPGLLDRLAALFAGGGAPAEASAGGGGLLGALASLLGGAAGPAREQTVSVGEPGPLARLLSRLFGPREASGGEPGRGAGGGDLPLQRNAPPEPGLLDRLRQLLARAVLSSRLAELLGRRQAEYLARMMGMFEDGDLDAALRHAIPLGALPNASPAPPALGVPSPRDELKISTGPRAAGGGLGVGPSLYERLRQLYRDAAARLEREGRIEEAAFVIAELLQQSEEAVSFLERHGRLKLAAELAEGRGLAPELVVRQWLVAGEPARAVAVARRTGSFAAAVLKLERTDPERGRALRRLWAESLAEAGDYAAAVATAWPVAELRGLARPWIEQGLTAGGAVEARLLPRWLALEPDAFPAVRERAEGLLGDESLEGAAARRALEDALVGAEASPGLAALCRPALRAALRDSAAGRAAPDAKLLQQLAERAADEALRADLPRASSAVRGARERPAGPRVLDLDDADTGARPIHDAARLPGGRLLVALGEAGAALLAPDGRPLAHLDRPAHRLVVSDAGQRALLLAPRGEVWRVARADLAARTVEDWAELRLTAWAEAYDGALWFAADGREAWALETTGPRPRALWRVADLPGPVAGLGRSPQQLSLVLVGEAPEAWLYELPRLALRRRGVSLYQRPAPAGGPVAFDAAGEPWALYRAEGGPLRLERGREAWELDGATPGATPIGLATAPSAAAAAVRTSGGCTIHFLRAGDAEAQLKLELGRASRVALRFGPDSTLLAADDRGRLLVYSLEHAALLRSLRL